VFTDTTANVIYTQKDYSKWCLQREGYNKKSQTLLFIDRIVTKLAFMGTVTQNYVTGRIVREVLGIENSHSNCCFGKNNNWK